MDTASAMRMAAAATAAMLCASPCRTDTYGFFRGVEHMVRNADAIVVAEVGAPCVPVGADGEWSPRAINHRNPQRECNILRTLFGDLEEGDALLALRWLGAPPGFEMPQWCESAPTERGTFLIFLRGWPPLSNGDGAGTIVPVPDGFRIEDLDAMTPGEAVGWIIGNLGPSEFLPHGWSARAVPPAKWTREDMEARRERMRDAPCRYDRWTCGRAAPSPWPPFDYDPTNGTAERGDVIRPRQE